MENFNSPHTIDELCELLKVKDNNTYIIAGGTDLIIHFNKLGIFDYNIIDITKIKELSEIKETKNEISIGANATMNDIENNEIIKKHVPALVDAAYNLGSKQIRNRATIGGNLANASQSGDTIPVLFAYDANVEIINSEGKTKILKAEDAIIGLEKNDLNSDEIITKILIKKSTSYSAFSKVGARKSVTISKLNCCLKIDLNDDLEIINPIIYLGAIGPKPIRAKFIENEIINKNIKDIDISDLKEAIHNEIEKAIPNRSSKYYKESAAYALVENVLVKLR